MVHGKKIIVVMPGRNVAETVERTYKDLPHDIVDEVILVDNKSSDDTAAVAERLGITVIRHPENRGYGGSQKTCYKTALEHGADVVIMVHPDYQYDPRLVLPMASMITDGPYDAVLASRIIGGRALKSGMPIWRYISNRFLTLFENCCTGAKLSEYHTGYRAFSKELIEALPLEKNSDDFVFDNQMLAQIIMKGFLMGEVSCPTRYFEEASSVNLKGCIKYGLGVMRTSIQFFLHRWGIWKSDFLR